MPDTQHAQLIAWLEDSGHSQADIERILAQVIAYDEKTLHESVFDSINAGTIDIAALIREVVKNEAE